MGAGQARRPARRDGGDAGAVVCFTGAEVVDGAGAPAPESFPATAFTIRERPGEEWLRHFFDEGDCLPLPSALAPRADLIVCGSLVQVADLDLWVRLAARGGIRIVAEQLARVRDTGGANASAPTRARSGGR